MSGEVLISVSFRLSKFGWCMGSVWVRPALGYATVSRFRSGMGQV